MSAVTELIARIRNTKPIENLSAIVGEELGLLLKTMIDEAELMDKELNLVHQCIADLMDVDGTLPRINKCLEQIKELDK